VDDNKTAPIYILLWTNGFSYPTLSICINVVAERQLYQDPASLVIIVQFLNGLYDLVDGSISR
jgi:hypothetical protein